MIGGMQHCFCPTGFELTGGSTTACTGELLAVLMPLLVLKQLLIELFNPHWKILMSVIVSALVIKIALIPLALLCALAKLVMNFMMMQEHAQVSLWSTSGTCQAMYATSCWQILMSVRWQHWTIQWFAPTTHSAQTHLDHLNVVVFLVID